MKNKKIILLIIGILLVISALVGISYAYYIKSHSQENSNIVKTKCLNFSLTNEKNDINLDEQYPIPDSEGRKLTPYQFTITNTCEQFISYNVNLESLETTTMDSNAVKVMINNEAPVNLSTLNSTSVSIDSSKDSKILATGSLGSGDSVDYALRVWMDYGTSADTSSMDKVFESKIVVTAIVGTYKPIDYVSTLHDALLINEYAVTDVDNAINKIETKENPNFNSTAPAITLQEKMTDNISTLECTMIDPDYVKIDDATAGLVTSDSLLTIAQNYTFDSSSQKFTVKDLIQVDPTTIDYTEKNYYIIYDQIAWFQDYYINYSTTSEKYVYKIVSATKESVDNFFEKYKGIKYNLKVKKINAYESIVDKSDKGLYADVDDYGTSYYYRGNVVNNNVYFAGNYWKIIRINGDNSIRLLYNGSSKNATGLDQTIGYSQFNSSNNLPKYSGYMYGDITNGLFNNENDSLIKTYLENWYKSNILDKNYSDYIYDSGFCNDRKIISGDGISSADFAPYYRYTTTHVPSFKCANIENDLFTTNTSLFGNKMSKYPIGLITVDELYFAGNYGEINNYYAYTFSGWEYWTMSPASYSVNYLFTMVYAQYPSGYIRDWSSVSDGRSVRPVINLKADVEISGGIGTVNDPYIIKTT